MRLNFNVSDVAKCFHIGQPPSPNDNTVLYQGSVEALDEVNPTQPERKVYEFPKEAHTTSIRVFDHRHGYYTSYTPSHVKSLLVAMAHPSVKAQVHVWLLNKDVSWQNVLCGCGQLKTHYCSVPGCSYGRCNNVLGSCPSETHQCDVRRGVDTTERYDWPDRKSVV